jgi:hypothetical protein
MKALGLAIALVAAAGCVTLPPEQAARNAVVMEAARACQISHPTVLINGVDRYGRLETSAPSPAEWNAFRACFEPELQRLTERNPIGAGRVVIPPSGPTPTTVAIEVSGNAILVRAIMNDAQPVTFLLDTGASLTTVRPGALAAAGVEVSPAGPRIVSTVVGGRTVEMPYVRLRSLRVGDVTVEGIDVAAFDAAPRRRDIDGLLGSNFLNHFVVTIDRAGRTLTLAPPGR